MPEIDDLLRAARIDDLPDVAPAAAHAAELRSQYAEAESALRQLRAREKEARGHERPAMVEKVAAAEALLADCEEGLRSANEKLTEARRKARVQVAEVLRNSHRRELAETVAHVAEVERQLERVHLHHEAGERLLRRGQGKVPDLGTAWLAQPLRDWRARQAGPVLFPPVTNGHPPVVLVRIIARPGDVWPKLSRRERTRLASLNIESWLWGIGEVAGFTREQAETMIAVGLAEGPVKLPPARDLDIDGEISDHAATRPVQFVRWWRGYQVGEVAWFDAAEIERLTVAGIAEPVGEVGAAAVVDEPLVAVVLLGVEGLPTGNVRGDLAFFPRSRAEQLLAAKAARRPTAAELKGARVDLEKLEPPPTAKPHPLHRSWENYNPGPTPIALIVRTRFGVWNLGERAFFDPATAEALLAEGWAAPTKED